jgi:asparagine synthase (glutamine-hydrolysing)
MCGISGWLGAGTSHGTRDLERMSAALRHRGPDDEGTFVGDGHPVGLAHVRLSIIDLSPAGHQPMLSEDGQVVLVFNGEIYNYLALRRELVERGHRFVSQTDSEVLVHGYEEWGPDLVHRLAGMFALAIWDARQQRLFLARDPMGIKPLYYWLRPDGQLVFASEIKAFLALEDFRGKPHLPMLRQFLEFDFVHDTSLTSLEGVRKLPAGHRLLRSVQDATRRRPVQPERWYTPPAVEPEAPAGTDLAQRADRLHELLGTVTRQHLQADVPVGLLLSGGLDSSILAALAAREGPLRTLSMGFADSNVDERVHARRTSEHIGSIHEEITVHPDEVANQLEETVWHVDDLFGDWGVITTLLLYRKCREAGVKVVLVGEGSDELFGGYPQFERCGGERVRHGRARRTLDLYRWYSGRRWGVGLRAFASTIRELDREADRDFFSTVRLFETRHQLPNRYNMKVDKASMAASVEARVPFLDVRVADAAFRTPRSLLLREGTNKFLLRHMAERHGLLPAGIARRPKFGGSIAASWMDDVPTFRQFARDVILDPRGLTAEMGLDRAMRAYFDQGRKGRRFPHGLSIYSIAAWRLLMLNLWARRYLTGAAERAPGAGAGRGRPAWTT